MVQPDVAVAKPLVEVSAGLWHDSQAMVPIGTWLAVFKVTKAGPGPPVFWKLLPEAWQVAQPDEMPVWLIVQV